MEMQLQIQVDQMHTIIHIKRMYCTTAIQAILIIPTTNIIPHHLQMQIHLHLPPQARVFRDHQRLSHANCQTSYSILLYLQYSHHPKNIRLKKLPGNIWSTWLIGSLLVQSFYLLEVRQMVSLCGIAVSSNTQLALFAMGCTLNLWSRYHPLTPIHHCSHSSHLAHGFSSNTRHGPLLHLTTGQATQVAFRASRTTRSYDRSRSSSIRSKNALKS